MDKAYNIALNSKVQRYAVCNAMETLLVSERIAVKLLPKLSKALLITEWICGYEKTKLLLVPTSPKRQRKIGTLNTLGLLLRYGQSQALIKLSSISIATARSIQTPLSLKTTREVGVFA